MNSERETIEELRLAQLTQGDMNPLKSGTRATLKNDRFYVDLGPVSDPELDKVTFKFDANGNRYITFDAAEMTLEIDEDIPLGVYRVNMQLIDDNSQL